LHIVHAPLQVPKINLDKFSSVADWRRRRYLAMVNYMDDSISDVIAEMKTQQMYNDSLIVFSADK
jgi:arylsulfatase A-like enzyme